MLAALVTPEAHQVPSVFQRLVAAQAGLVPGLLVVLVGFHLVRPAKAGEAMYRSLLSPPRAAWVAQVVVV
jgi:hypothetical protein